MHRMELNNWNLMSPLGNQLGDNHTSLNFRGVAPRNTDRARRRWQRANIAPISEELGLLPLADEAAPQFPSGDEMVPDLPQGTLSWRPPFSSADSSPKSVYDSGADRPTSNVQPPERPGEDLDAPPIERVRTESQEARIAGNNEFRERHRLIALDRAGALTIGEDDLQGAIRFPALGRPAYDIIFPTGKPDRQLEPHVVNGTNVRDSPPTHPFTRVGNAGPLSVALAVATIVTQHEFRMMGVNGDLECPLAPTHF